MNKSIAAISGAALLGMLTSPASAIITLVDASSIQGENVLFNNGTTTGTTVFGSTNQTDTAVKFTSTASLIASGGQADITGGLNLSTKNPNDTFNYNNLAISLVSGGTFDNLELNLFGGNATSVSFTLVGKAGDVFNFSNLALANGSNFFGFTGVNNDSIRSASYTTNAGTGIEATRQIRLDGVPMVNAVPEPATWGMMMVGLFGVGLTVRKSRKTGLKTSHAR